MNIKEIARLSGVSVSTVSRVLNNHPYVSKNAREKVLKIIEENHFVPHSGAVDLVRPQSDGIGIIVRGTGNIFFTEIMPLIENLLYEYGYNVYNTRIHSNEDEIQAAQTLAKSKNLVGIIFMGGRQDYTKEDMVGITIPYVCCTYTNSFGNLDEFAYSSVHIDDIQESVKAMNYLIDNGHRKIAFVLPDCHDRSIGELRYHGYVKALQDNGIEEDKELIVETGDYQPESAYQRVCEFIDSGKEFDSIFAISDTIALVSIKALSDKGLRVPDDISVIGIDGMKISNYSIPTLTTIVQPINELAIETVDLLNGYLKLGKPHSHVVEKGMLRIGQSVKKRP